MSESTELISRYYAAFNRGDFEAMLALVSDDVAHDVNQGGRELGRDAFRAFLARMNTCYSEQVVQLVICENVSGLRCAAEFDVIGTYLKTDPGFPEARGQRYHLPAGAFFDIRDGLIARVTTHYNVRDWLAQIGV